MTKRRILLVHLIFLLAILLLFAAGILIWRGAEAGREKERVATWYMTNEFDDNCFIYFEDVASGAVYAFDNRAASNPYGQPLLEITHALNKACNFSDSTARFKGDISAFLTDAYPIKYKLVCLRGIERGASGEFAADGKTETHVVLATDYFIYVNGCGFMNNPIFENFFSFHMLEILDSYPESMVRDRDFTAALKKYIESDVPEYCKYPCQYEGDYTFPVFDPRTYGLTP